MGVKLHVRDTHDNLVAGPLMYDGSARSLYLPRFSFPGSADSSTVI